jgi:hypothetical protein
MQTDINRESCSKITSHRLARIDGSGSQTPDP